jgi:hypothetical protein
VSLFQVRLGLSILELVHRSRADTGQLAENLRDTALGTGDAYAARDLLAREGIGLVGSTAQLSGLTELLTLSGLDSECI